MGGCETSFSCLYPFGTDIGPPCSWLSCREGFCGSQRLCPTALLPHGCWVPVGSTPWFPEGQRGLCFISACRLWEYVPAWLHFRSLPLLCFRKSSTCCWYVFAAGGLPAEALSLFATLPPGAPSHGSCSAALLVHGSDRLSIWWHIHLEDAAVGRRRGGRGLKVPTR